MPEADSLLATAQVLIQRADAPARISHRYRRFALVGIVHAGDIEMCSALLFVDERADERFGDARTGPAAAAVDHVCNRRADLLKILIVKWQLPQRFTRNVAGDRASG
jgi:hypothetical protein